VNHRTPYVGEGADGARRSGQIDLSEADTLPTSQNDPFWTETAQTRKDELLLSAERWQMQADELENNR
jgi:hypothetical protein